jgi:hypothetical protein
MICSGNGIPRIAVRNGTNAHHSMNATAGTLESFQSDAHVPTPKASSTMYDQ